MFLKGLLLVIKSWQQRQYIFLLLPFHNQNYPTKKTAFQAPKQQNNIFPNGRRQYYFAIGGKKSSSIARASNSRPTIFMGNRKMDTALCHEKAAAENQSGFSFFSDRENQT